MFGDDGDDVFYMMRGAVAAGGAGADEFNVEVDWLNQPVGIADYDPTEDAIVITVEEGTPISLTITETADGWMVELNAVQILLVQGSATFTVADLNIVEVPPITEAV